METPASAFDVFLHQLYVAANGMGYFGGPNMKEQLRIYKLDYDYGTNLVHMGFHISPDHELMKGFNTKDIEGKKNIMLRAAKDIATSVGVEDTDGLGQFGLIHYVKIRNGWSSRDFNESKIKEEIAERTVVEITYAWEDKFLYQVRRTPFWSI